MAAHPAATGPRLRKGDFGSAAIALIGVTARVLGWRPDEFWAATPADLAAALGGEESAGGIDRAGLAAMMEAFPDG